jgi:AcrR family transcriptional regulator
MPKIVDHKLRYRELGKVAAFAMADRGPDKLTFAQLAKEANCSVGAVTYYVKSKDEILLMAGKYVANDAFHRVSAVRAKYAGLEALRRVLYEILPFNSPHPKMRDIMFIMWAKASEHREIREAVQSGYKWMQIFVADLIREAQEAGEIPAHLDARKTAQKTVTHMDGLVVLIRISENRVSTKEQRDHVDDWLAQFVNSRPAKVQIKPASL